MNATVLPDSDLQQSALPEPAGRLRVVAGVLFILVLASFLRCAGITQTEVWRDEAITLIHVQATWWELFSVLPRVEDTPPLSFLIFKAWGGLQPSQLLCNETWMRLLPVLLGVATVGVLMRTAAFIHPRAWWPVGLLAAVSHVPVHYSQEIRTYSLLCFATVLALWTAERAVRAPGQRRWLVLLAVWGALAGHCHAVGVFVYPVVVAYLLVRVGPGDRQRVWRTWIHGLWLVAVIPVAVFSMHWSRVHGGVGEWWVPPLDVRGAGGILWRYLGLHPVEHWALVGEGLGRHWFAFAVENAVMLLTGGLVALALLDVRTRGRFAVQAGAAGLFVGFLMLGSELALPNLIVRTLLPAWMLAMLALGLGGVASPGGRVRWLGPCLVILLVVIHGGMWLAMVRLGDKRRPASAAGLEWIRAQLQPDDLILTWPTWYEDQVVYHLQDVVRGEQLYTHFKQVYAGRPAKHQLIHRGPVPETIKRLRDALSAHRERTGGRYAVYVVRNAVLWYSDSPLDFHQILSPDHEETDSYSSPPGGTIHVTRYVPAKMADRSCSATSSAPGAP
ncbi:MAG: hypothetical protein GXY55_14015 [Phycisphaerae bacterium]|nr:hypothetical protein [Phycisphaerae bacterium]